MKRLMMGMTTLAVSTLCAAVDGLDIVKGEIKQPSWSQTILVEPDVVVGPIKPMNAVNNGPEIPRSDQTRSSWREFKNLKVPYTRNHDANANWSWGGGHVCDITALFPNFDADENDPANYDFAMTDEWVKGFNSVGTRTFFRLGQTIEHFKKKYGVLPPKDFAKWARICEHVIAHYSSEKWADGFDAGIEYWEIWNEADLDAGGESWKRNPRTWGGSPEQFYEFYATAAKHLKARFPKMKIGGPAICAGPGKWSNDFFAYMKKHDVPIDFFSWHIYSTNPMSIANLATSWRKSLDEHGYASAESICNEWNFVIGWNTSYQKSINQLHALKGGIFTAATMLACQDRPVDMLMYYQIRNSCFDGVFDFYSMAPMPGYWALYSWNELVERGRQVKCSTLGKAQYQTFAVAATDEQGKGVLVLAHYNSDDNAAGFKQFNVGVKGRPFTSGKVHLLDSRFTYGETSFDIVDGVLNLQLEPLSLVVIPLPDPAPVAQK